LHGTNGINFRDHPSFAAHPLVQAMNAMMKLLVKFQPACIMMASTSARATLR
jgi:hypothetical protein